MLVIALWRKSKFISKLQLMRVSATHFLRMPIKPSLPKGLIFLLILKLSLFQRIQAMASSLLSQNYSFQKLN